MAAIVNKDNNNENANKKTILTQYANKYNYLDKLILSWDEIDEHEAHDSSDLIRPKQISSTKVADREDAFGRVKKTVIPVPDEHHYKQNIISMLQTVDTIYIDKRREALVKGSDNAGDDTAEENPFMTPGDDTSSLLNYFQIKAIKNKYEAYEMRKRKMDGHANDKHSTLNALANIHLFFVKQLHQYPLRTKSYYLRYLLKTISTSSSTTSSSTTQNLKPHHFLKKDYLFGLLEGLLIDVESSKHVYENTFSDDKFYDFYWYKGILDEDGQKSNGNYDIRFEKLSLDNIPSEQRVMRRTDRKYYKCLVKAFVKHMKQIDNIIINGDDAYNTSSSLSSSHWVINNIQEFFSCIMKYMKFISQIKDNNNNNSTGMIDDEFKTLSQVTFLLNDTLHPLEKDILEMEYLHITEKEKMFIMSPTHLENILISMSKYTEAFINLRISTYVLEAEPSTEFHTNEHHYFKPGTYEADSLYIHEAKTMMKDILSKNEYDDLIESFVED